jgi:endonuclease-3 related protein
MKNLLKIFERLYSFYGPQHWWPGETPFEIAVGAILTQNTNWGNVEKAITNLKAAGLLSPEKLEEIQEGRLAELIRPAGYFNIKAKRLKAFISLLMNSYQGSMKKMKKEDLQYLRHKLLEVNGIGPETADSILLYALGKPVFVIDAYTRRVLSRHNILPYDAPYEEYQRLFHDGLDEDVPLFNEYHALFVRVGKDFCRPKPRCEDCPLKVFL